ncbi:glycosyltransferase [Enterococcus sp. ALS3]|uniref:Glycosyltransferase n=1 Tax=Enterococcus alishanensis TaxID=1303817 RepID=A0ABS6TAB2_9ENTE|nr:glycosyltransferase [Enterococcus alishanensis]MBV7389844.1 glycosyltransferase [Enterococcus alishanensis]
MNKKDFSISVCMATYNGIHFIEAQLNSILPQLAETDELIISDDHSTDGTWDYLTKRQQEDTRIQLHLNPQKGLTKNFENAISRSQNELIFLSDQDDVWATEKVAVTKEYFAKAPDKTVIISDLMIVDNDFNEVISSYQKMRHTKNGFWANLIRSSYIGAGMAFRKSLTQLILPIPTDVPMHDMWIGLLADSQKGVQFIPEKLVYYRRHDFNVSEIKTTANKKQQFIWRWQALKLVRQRIREFKKNH